jgi:cell division protein FtsB
MRLPGVNMGKALKISLLSFTALCLLALWLVFGNGGLVYLHNKDKEKQAYVEKIRKLDEENQRLMEEIDRLKNDKEYIEETARKELGMVRDGEVFYKFNEEDGKTRTKQKIKKEE